MSAPATGREVVVVDLGMGNLRSVARALQRAGAAPRITADPDAVARAARLVVPGQGHFRDCGAALARGLGEAVRGFVATGRPYLGICLGMQALFATSEEAPGTRGLGLVPGSVRRFGRALRDPRTGERLKVPHVGWSEVRSAHPLLVDAGSWFYFVHSYRCEPDDPRLVAATSDHGGPFCAALAWQNVFAVQFHPEKSGEAGHSLLVRFLRGQWT